MTPPRVAVVIPCYRVTAHILDVLGAVPPSVERIYVVDDACPDGSGALVESKVSDSRVQVLRSPENQGVGGATLLGYRRALSEQMDVVVKLDGDGQMDPSLIPRFVAPIARGAADYTKGNRFFSLEMLRPMPLGRLLGNAAISIVNKAVSGYWSVMDPTNGFTAISARVLAHLSLDKLEKRYFFESDMLFRLGLLRAHVVDIPMHARYGGEKSHLSVLGSVLRFPGKFAVRSLKRFVYAYLLRDFNPGSLQALLGFFLVFGGGSFGAYRWARGILENAPATSGTVMLASLPIILGAQLLMAALQYDIQNQPHQPIQQSL
jgi:dolichol-phosphate mannosyltransferase